MTNHLVHILLLYFCKCYSLLVTTMAQSSYSYCLVIFLRMVHSPDFFCTNSSNIFSLRVRLLGMALVEHLGYNSWQVVCAACCHMVLVFAIIILCIYVTFFIFYCPFLFMFFFCLVLINQTEWLITPACPSLMSSLTGATLKGLTL